MATKRMDEATKKRVRAGRLLQRGKKPAEIALDVGVARQTVYTWKAIFDEGGIDALRAVLNRLIASGVLQSPYSYRPLSPSLQHRQR